MPSPRDSTAAYGGTSHGVHTLFMSALSSKVAGRWNRAGQYGCLYTSLTRDGAITEYRKYRQQAGITVAMRPRDLVSIEARIDPVVDLTDGRSSPVSPQAAYLTSDEEEDLEICRALAGRLIALAAKPDKK